MSSTPFRDASHLTGQQPHMIYPEGPRLPVPSPSSHREERAQHSEVPVGELEMCHVGAATDLHPLDLADVFEEGFDAEIGGFVKLTVDDQSWHIDFV